MSLQIMSLQIISVSVISALISAKIIPAIPVPAIPAKANTITGLIFIICKLQEKYLAKNNELWMVFVDLEKAFDRVPWEMVWWALRYLGVDEWIVSVIKGMYEDASTKVRMNGWESKAFNVRVGMH